MNTVLQFAIDNQGRTRAVLLSKGVAESDVDDCAQGVLVSLFRADPQGVHCPEAYWITAVHNAAVGWRRQRARRTPVFVRLDDSIDGKWLEDPKQDHVTSQEMREEIAAALGQATDREREALVRMLTQPERAGRMTGSDRVRIHRFRRRLQGAMA